MAATIPSQPPRAPSSHTPRARTKQGKDGKSKKGKAKENHSSVTTKQHSTESSKSNIWENWESPSEWEWSALTKPSSSKAPPIYTKDGSYFFALVGSSVRIHSVATGQIVSTLSIPRSTSSMPSSDALTSAILNPHNPFQLITSSLDGRLMIWDFLDATLLQTISIGQPIHYMCTHEEFRDTVFVTASLPRKTQSGNDYNAVVLRVSLKTVNTSEASSGQRPTDLLPIGKIRTPTGLAFSSNGAWLVATGGHTAYVARTSSLSSGFTKYVSPEHLTCLAFHPFDEYFATGDEKGNIRLWYCLNENLAVNAHGLEKRTQTSSMHWHAHAVSSVSFTANGAYLLSGGEEAVLVIWQLHTGKKEFVPRLGGPIRTVSVAKSKEGEEEYLVGLVDGTYAFVSAGNLRISRSYSRVKIDPAMSIELPSTSRSVSAPLAVHPLSSTLILPSSHPSSLQIYSPSSSTLISELEVSPSNRVSRREEKAIESARVESSVVSLSGQWMASIDAREGDEDFHPEVYLKFWAWDAKSSSWILNTRIDRPHGPKRVLHTVFSPSSSDQQFLQLVTVGEDGNIKVWRLRSRKTDAGVKEEFWIALSTFSFRSERPRWASWSPDASLFAISLGPYIAVYDPISLDLRQTLISPECQATASVHFIGRGGRYILAVCKSALVLWDLVAQSVRWQCDAPADIEFVIPHPQEEAFAVFYHVSAKNEDAVGTRVSIFNASSSTPSSIHSVPFCLRSVSWYSPLHSTDIFNFVAATREWNIVVFGDHIQAPTEEGATAKGISGEISVQKKSLFQDIFGKSAFADVSNEMPPSQPRSMRPDVGSNGDLEGIFDVPAYLTPALNSLFEPAITTFLKPRLMGVTSASVQEGDDDDIDMEEKETEPLILGSTKARVVDQQELDLLTKLFREHSVNVQQLPSLPKVNGKANGVAKGKVNGVSRPSTSLVTTPLKQNGTPPRSSTKSVPQTNSPMSTPNPTSVSSSQNTHSKKRKKSLG